MWNNGVSFSPAFVCSYWANPFLLLQPVSPAAPSGMLGQGSSLPSPLPCAGWMNGAVCDPRALPGKQEPGAIHGFFI